MGFRCQSRYPDRLFDFNVIIVNKEEFPGLVIKNPNLWWPNGYGEQNLYTLQIKSRINNSHSDKIDLKFGIREFDYIEKPEATVLKVNGEKIME